MTRRRASWAALALVVGTALFVGSRGDGSPPTDAERAQRIAETIRCPTCRSQSMADSDAPAARQGRDEILRRVAAGQTDGQVRDYFVGRFNTDILLDPPKEGVSALVWALPVMAVTAAAAALAVAFRRWRPRRRQATDTDRALVEEALHQS
ncbi:MAG: cytochrome c-type biogenesis protein [Acidimicrobiales bacterium]